jgi:ApaG protein
MNSHRAKHEEGSPQCKEESRSERGPSSAPVGLGLSGLTDYSGWVSTRLDFVELDGLRVTVDKVIYQPDAAAPLDRPHCFVYFITIHNDADVAVTIKGRKWVVTNDRNEITAVEGEGVVGQTPLIQPGESFSYNSFHLLSTRSAVAEGSYVGLDERGRTVLARIPKFSMVLPDNQ